MSSDPAVPFRLGSLAFPVYVPSLLFAVGTGATLPVVAAVAVDLGASLAIAGLVAALLMVGGLIGDLPAGSLIARIGERRAMLIGTMLATSGMVVCVVAAELPGSVPMLGLGMLVTGMASSVFAIGRHSFLTSFVPLGHRARALSTLGGVFRGGTFLGPLLGGALISLTGWSGIVFVIAVVSYAFVAVVVLFLPDPEEVLRASRARTSRLPATSAEPIATSSTDARAAPTPETAEARADVGLVGHGIWRTIKDHRRVLLTLGAATSSIAVLRSTRQVLLPLWAVSLGIAEAEASLIIGLAGVLDFLLFYLGGWLMDRFGRGSTAVPTALGLGLGHLVLAGLVFLTDPWWGFVAVAAALALGNGVGSGILMTMGSDLAPPANPTPFLAAWRLEHDLGQAAGPLAVSGITALSSLAVATAAIGAVGLVGAALLAVFIPRYLVRPER